MSSPINPDGPQPERNTRARKLSADLWVQVRLVGGGGAGPQAFWGPVRKRLQNREDLGDAQLEARVRNRLGPALTARWRWQTTGPLGAFIQPGLASAEAPQASFAVAELRYGTLEVGLAVSGISVLGQAFGFGLDDLDAFLVFAFPEAFEEAVGDRLDLSADYEFEVLDQHSSRLQSAFGAGTQAARAPAPLTLGGVAAKGGGLLKTELRSYVQRNAANILLLIVLGFLIITVVDVWKGQRDAFGKLLDHQAKLLEIDLQRIAAQAGQQAGGDKGSTAPKAAEPGPPAVTPTP
jgi:hypothetical protein